MAEKDWRAKATTFWQDGKLTIAWLAVFAAYLGFRIADITAPELTNAFVTITGIFVGTLGVSQSKKKAEEAARVEHKADQAVAIAGQAVEAATGEMPPIIKDPHTGDLRAQQPPRISKGDKDA